MRVTGQIEGSVNNLRKNFARVYHSQSHLLGTLKPHTDIQTKIHNSQ